MPVAGFSVEGGVFKSLVKALDVVDAEYWLFTRSETRVSAMDAGRVMLLDLKISPIDYYCEKDEVWVLAPTSGLVSFAKRVKKRDVVKVEVENDKLYVSVVGRARVEVGSVVPKEEVPDFVIDSFEGVRNVQETAVEGSLTVVVSDFRRIVESAKAERWTDILTEKYENVGIRIRDGEADIVFFGDVEHFSHVEIRGYVEWVLRVEGRAKATYRLEHPFSSTLILGLSDTIDIEVRTENLGRTHYRGDYYEVDFWFAPLVDGAEKVFQDILAKPVVPRTLMFTIEGDELKTLNKSLRAISSIVVGEEISLGVAFDWAAFYWSNGFFKVWKYEFTTYLPPETYSGKFGLDDVVSFLKNVEKLECYLEGGVEKPTAIVLVGTGPKIAPKEIRSVELVKGVKVPEVDGRKVRVFTGQLDFLSDVVYDAETAEDAFLLFISTPNEITAIGKNKIYYVAPLPLDSFQFIEEDYIPVYYTEFRSLKDFFSKFPGYKVTMGKIETPEAIFITLEAENDIGELKAAIYQDKERLKEAIKFYEEYTRPPPPPRPPEVKPLAPPPPPPPPKLSLDDFRKRYMDILNERLKFQVELLMPGLRGEVHYIAPEREEEAALRFTVDNIKGKYSSEIEGDVRTAYSSYETFYGRGAGDAFMEKWLPDRLHGFARNLADKFVRQLIEEVKAVPPPEKRLLRDFPEQIRTLEETLIREAEAQFRVLPVEEWLRHRATVRDEIRSAIRAFENFPKEEAENRIRERVIKFVSELIERLRAPPPPPPPAVVPMVAPPAVEIVYAPREKPITKEEMQAIKRELKVESMEDLLDKVLKGEVKPEEVKRVHEELMMKRRLEKRRE